MSKFCSNCGQALPENATTCPTCGKAVPQPAASQPGAAPNGAQQSPIIVNVENKNVNTAPVPHGEPKSKWVAFFLCLFFGCLGAHKFYEGKIGMGILYLFTLGLCGIGTIVDLFILLFKPTHYYIP